MSKIGELEAVKATYIEKINEYLQECLNLKTLDLVLSILKRLA